MWTFARDFNRRALAQYVEQELRDWADLGVEGHFAGKNPWLTYHRLLTQQTAELVGAEPSEVVVMNSLTVNLHLMMVSFYRPTADRHKILVEGGAFPSDQYAVKSQIRFHGFDPHHRCSNFGRAQMRLACATKISMR